MRRDWDVLMVLVVTPLLILSIFLMPDVPLRIVLGLPFLLFFPGYVTVLALFPEKEDLEPLERVALSFGLSIAIAPLIGFGLNYTPFGIRLVPILACLSVFNIVVALVGQYRRNLAIAPYLPFDPVKLYNDAIASYRKEKGVDKALTIILVISIIASVVALVYVIAVPRQGESFTEFYILGPGGKAEGYPHDLTAGEEASIIIGIANHEHRTVNYTVELWLVNATFVNNETQVHEMYWFDSFNIELDHQDVDLEGNWTAQWELFYTFSVNKTGKYKLWFLLYKDGAPALPSGIEMKPYADFTGTDAEQRIILAVKNEVQSLNLNLRISS
ncbi:MAG: DUF1616 domain-containing protein [Methanomassiliicoccales archaeon]|nr:MAG: DUF1616 domain-containing protein [Methanomassiliicoccales archaeon]